MEGARGSAWDSLRTVAGADPGTRTRGYLFADLRGYTAYVESAGAAAGADLLNRYRVLVRAQVQRHNGAEIRTEGDSFYVVLTSASVAVQCGLDVAAAARSASDASWSAPIRVGVGIHAGEAVATPEGPVGTAINIAARLCAMAAPGEVLVSDTVRALTRSVLPVDYVSQGRHRLKGVAEPIEVFRAFPAGEGAPPRRRRPWSWLALAAGIVLVVLILGSAFAL